MIRWAHRSVDRMKLSSVKRKVSMCIRCKSPKVILLCQFYAYYFFLALIRQVRRQFTFGIPKRKIIFYSNQIQNGCNPLAFTFDFFSLPRKWLNQNIFFHWMINELFLYNRVTLLWLWNRKIIHSGNKQVPRKTF